MSTHIPKADNSTLRAPSQHLTYQQMDILHCLRGFCAFYVVVYHAKFILWAGGREYLSKFPRVTWNIGQYIAFALDMFSSAGYEMVIFFFVLSGFFIRYAQLRKHRSPIAFYINRIVRIYPPYLFSAVLGVVILVVLMHFSPQIAIPSSEREMNHNLPIAMQDLYQMSLNGVGRTLLFTPQVSGLYLGYNMVYWSLLPEALFYALVPLAFWRIRVYYIVSMLLYMMGVAAALRHIEIPIGWDFITRYNFYFAVGAALYDAVVGTKCLNWFRRASGILLAVCVLALFTVLIALALMKLNILSGIVATLLAVLCVCALLAGRISAHNIVLRIFHPIGIFSFSLYLYHFPLLLLCAGIAMVLTGETVYYSHFYWLVVLLVTLVSYGLYWVTERLSVKFFRKS